MQLLMMQEHKCNYLSPMITKEKLRLLILALDEK